ncbi:MAG: trimethylamine methyltransferase family protein, partial [Spirochaetia bacterium]
AVLSGTSFIHNLGYLSAGKTGSLEMLVLCDEIAGSLKTFVKGVDVDEETLAVDVTRRGYKDHSFMMDEHTLSHMRTALWQPSIFQRATREQWSELGSVQALDRIRVRVTELLHS